MTPPESTVSVRLANGAAGPVAGSVTLAMCARAGLPPLAAARAGASVSSSLAGCREAVTLTFEVTEPSTLTVRIDASEADLRHLAERLEEHGAELIGGALELAFSRTPLHPA